MTRGRTPNANKAPAGVSHHPAAGEQIVEYAPQACSRNLVREYAEGLPAGTPLNLFLRSVEELGDKIRDFDLQLLQEMALHFHNAEQAQADVRERGLFEETMYGRKPNPALKIGRDELNAAMKIADQYALTFVSRLRAGILQLAGQSMMQQIHTEMASAIVAQILELPPMESAIVQPVIARKALGRMRKSELLSLALELGAEVPDKPTCASLRASIKALP